MYTRLIKSEMNSRTEDRKYCQGPKTIGCNLSGHSQLDREENKV